MSEDTTTNGTPAPATTGSQVSMVPSFRLREETERRQKAENGYKDASASMAAMQSELEAVRNQLANVKATHGQDLSLLEAGIKDAEVRDFIRERYTRIDSESRPQFSEWLTGQRENPSPLLAPFLQRQAEQAVAESITPPTDTAPEPTPAKRAAPPNPNAGTDQPARPSPGNWTNDDIQRAIAQSGGRGLGANRDAILKALAAEGLIKTKLV
jgi:hypothetical protein